MEKVIQPKFSILYNNNDITTDIKPFIMALNYIDVVESESDTIEITVDDTDGNWRFIWFPEKGATLDVSIGYDETLIPCGVFTIDEIAFSGPPEKVSIRGLASPISLELRTKKSRAHENKKLSQIAATIANENGLTLLGDFDEDILIKRSTQNDESDLSYLNRLGIEFGYLFSVRDSQLIFSSILNIEATASVTEVSRTDITRYDFTDKGVKTYSAAVVKYRDPNQNKLIKSEVTSSETDVSSDKLEVITKAENMGQAERKAQIALHRSNTRKVKGTLSLFGNPALLAGSSFDLVRMGALSGKYHIIRSNHSLSASSGYTTNIEIKKIGDIDQSRW